MTDTYVCATCRTQTEGGPNGRRPQGWSSIAAQNPQALPPGQQPAYHFCSQACLDAGTAIATQKPT